MKIFFDTNVWIAAFLTPGACSEVLEHGLTHHSLLTSRQVLDEISDKLINKLRFSRTIVGRFLKFVRENTELVHFNSSPPCLCRDPDDNKILAAALAGEADCLISGDRDLLSLESFEEIPVIKPSDFWRFEQTHHRKRSSS